MSKKYYKVKHYGKNEIMDGSSIGLLQSSGSHVIVKHRVYKCPSCGSWEKNIPGCTNCGFDATEIDIY